MDEFVSESIILEAILMISEWSYADILESVNW